MATLERRFEYLASAGPLGAPQDATAKQDHIPSAPTEQQVLFTGTYLGCTNARQVLRAMYIGVR
jgi:hypothetical protein